MSLSQVNIPPIILTSEISHKEEDAMAPPSADIDTESHTNTSQSTPNPQKVRLIPEIKHSITGPPTKSQSLTSQTPLQYEGKLNNYESFDATSVIGREFPKLQLTA